MDTLIVSTRRNLRVEVSIRGDELRQGDLVNIKDQFIRWLAGLDEAFGN